MPVGAAAEESERWIISEGEQFGSKATRGCQGRQRNRSGLSDEGRSGRFVSKVEWYVGV